MADLHKALHYFTSCWHGYQGEHVIPGHGVTQDRSYYTTDYKCCHCGSISESLPFSYLLGGGRITGAPR